jgi:hypothetical protein
LGNVVSAPAPLLPRYRRPLSFGGVLDETFRIYRAAWPKLMAVTALAALPGGLALIAFAGGTYSLALSSASVAGEDTEELGRQLAGLGAGSLLASIVYGLGALVGQGGVTAMTGWLLRGEDHSVWASLGAALRKLLAMLGYALLYGLGIFLLALVALPLFFVGLGGVLGGLVALIGLAVWVNRPQERRTNGLKWLIILATPFGLPVYYGVRWSLAIPAILLEDAGPLEAMRRSSALVEGRWFQVFGVWVVMGIVVGILESIPGLVIGAVGAGIAATAADPRAAGTVAGIAQNAANIIGAVLFGALTFVAATILFADARNRREGTDLEERLDQLQPGLQAAT